jgi:hypothetical protein
MPQSLALGFGAHYLLYQLMEKRGIAFDELNVCASAMSLPCKNGRLGDPALPAIINDYALHKIKML